MSNYSFTDNQSKITAELKSKIAQGLEQIGSTAEIYAKELCPVRTGKLRDSITHDVYLDEDENLVRLMTDVEYAPYVEMGTARSAPHPFLRPAMQDHLDEYKSILENALKSD